MSERSIVTLVIAILALIGGYVVCDAAFDDEDEPGDLGGAPAWVLRSDPPDGRPGGARDCDDQCGNQHSDCENNRGECSDDDQVQVGPICVEDGACRFG